MRIVMTMGLAAACVCAAAPVRAQEHVKVWAEGRYLENLDWTQEQTLHKGPGSGVAVGIDFSRWFGMEMAVDWSSWSQTVTQDFSSVRYGGQRIFETSRQRAPELSVSFAAHVVEMGRVRITLLAGLGAVPSRRSRIVDELLGPNGVVLYRTVTDGARSQAKSGLAFGADVPVRLVGRLSVVPSVHVLYWPVLFDQPGHGFVRPSIGVRWAF